MTAAPRWVTRSPRLLHLTTTDAAPILADLGLRPTTWLVANADGLGDERREHLLTTPRRESVWLDVRGHRIRLRDQQPLASGWASRLVNGEHPGDYLRDLNDHSFLFPHGAPGLDRLRAKYVDDGLLLELDAEAMLTNRDIAARTRLVDHNPGAVSRFVAEPYLSRTRRHTIEAWDAGHPRGRRPREVLIRGGLSPAELDDVLIDTTRL